MELVTKANKYSLYVMDFNLIKVTSNEFVTSGRM